MGRASQKFDRQLFTLKLAELSRQMQIKSAASDRKAVVASRERGNSLLMHMVGGQLALLRDEWLTGIDRIAREVWQTQREAMTPDFVREILVPEAMNIIRAKESQIKRGVTSPAPLTRLNDPYPARHHLSREIRKLKGEVTNRYEIEARELGYRNTPTEGAVPEEEKKSKQGSQPRKAQSTGIIPGQFQGPTHEERLRFELRGKPTDVPANPPSYFPDDLWPQTNVILLESRKKFPRRSHTLEMCRHIVSEMTPLFCEAVKAGKMKVGAVLCEGLGGMEDLLHFLLVHNDDGPPTGFGLSDKAYRLGQKVRQSDEWLALAKAIAGVQGESAPKPTEVPGNPYFPDVWSRTEHLRTDAKQAESPHAQNNANSAQDVESKPTNATAANERESFVQPILDGKGWSIHQLALEAEVDFHTVNDYLKGRTRPNRSTRKHLADALGIAVDRLPK